MRRISRFVALAALVAIGGSLAIFVAAHAQTSFDAPLKGRKDGKPTRIACIGDSITAGVGASRPANSYPGLLGLLLGDGFVVGNFGESGATLLKQGDSPYWKRGGFATSDAFQPDAIVLMLGTNDSKPQNWAHKSDFAADYAALLDHYAGLPSHPQLFVCLPPQVTRSGNFGIAEAPILQQIPMIREAAARKGAAVIDVHGAMGPNPANLVDDVHPRDAGYVILAGAVYQGLTHAPLILPAGGKQFAGALTATVRPPAPDVVVRVTQDGTDPSAASPVYTGPMRITRAGTLRARAFRGSRPYGLTSSATFTPSLNLALDRKVTVSDPNVFNWGIGGLTDGSWEANQAHCFATGDKDTFPKTAVIDLERASSISAIVIGVPPFGATRTVEAAISADGTTWNTIGSHQFAHRVEARHTFTFPAAVARYVRLTYPDHDADGAGYTPTFVFTTECEVYAVPPKP